jgi:hypothetical protein
MQLKMNIWCFVLLMIWAGANPIAAQNRNGEIDIYLCIGQSNMAGVAPILSLDQEPLENTLLLNPQNQWEKAVCTNEGLNRYSTVKKPSLQLLAPSYTFAKKIERYAKHPIGIVANARGGTQIEWWQKGYEGPNDNNLYEQAILKVKAALAVSPGSKIKAIIWHQGESDNSSPRKELYLSRLKKLVVDLRTDLGDQTIPFVAGEVGQWKGRGKGVNPMIRQIADSIANASWVTSNGLTSVNLSKNDPHFDTFSQRSLGSLYADKVLEMIYQQPIGGVTFFTDADGKGRSVQLKSGTYPTIWLEEMGISLAEITLIKLDKGYKVNLLTNGKIVQKLVNSGKLKEFAFDQVQVIYTK